MSRPPVFPAEGKVRIVLSVLSGEMAIAEAAGRDKVLRAVGVPWKAQFLAGGRPGVTRSGKAGRRGCEEQPQARVEELSTALGKARVGCGCRRSPRSAA